jgi:putative FmdB family regulatory protein
MPTYDYACSGCGHRFERFESIGEDGPKTCPKCRRKKARRMIGAGAGFIFKGSGFYATDYKRPAPGAPAGERKEPEKKKTARKEKREEPKK